jgi:hypothetical protein
MMMLLPIPHGWKRRTLLGRCYSVLLVSGQHHNTTDQQPSTRDQNHQQVLLGKKSQRRKKSATMVVVAWFVRFGALLLCTTVVVRVVRLVQLVPPRRTTTGNPLAQWIADTPWAQQNQYRHRRSPMNHNHNNRTTTVVLCTVCVDGHYGKKPEWRQVILENHRRYAQAHGYRFIAPTTREELQQALTTTVVTDENHQQQQQQSDNEDPLKIGNMYWRLPLLQSLLSAGIDGHPVDWAFYSDCDTVFTNFHVPLETFLHPSKSFLVSGDSFGDPRWEAPVMSINSGHMLLKNTDFSRALLANVTMMRYLYFTDRNTWNRVVDQE